MSTAFALLKMVPNPTSPPRKLTVAIDATSKQGSYARSSSVNPLFHSDSPVISPSSIENIKYRRSLSDLFKIVDSASVTDFIAQHSLRLLIEDAHDYLRMHFHRNDFVLRLFRDYEEPDLEFLTINVVPLEESDREIQKLEYFRRHWWVQSLHKADGKLTIGLSLSHV